MQAFLKTSLTTKPNNIDHKTITQESLLSTEWWGWGPLVQNRNTKKGWAVLSPERDER